MAICFVLERHLQLGQKKISHLARAAGMLHLAARSQCWEIFFWRQKPGGTAGLPAGLPQFAGRADGLPAGLS
jgi:hypothetical protein